VSHALRSVSLSGACGEEGGLLDRGVVSRLLQLVGWLMAVFRAGLTIFLLAQAMSTLDAGEISFFCTGALARRCEPSFQSLPPRNVPVANQTISETCPDARSEEV
jgi:hypothetical protein